MLDQYFYMNLLFSMFIFYIVAINHCKSIDSTRYKKITDAKSNQNYKRRIINTAGNNCYAVNIWCRYIVNMWHHVNVVSMSYVSMTSYVCWKFYLQNRIFWNWHLLPASGNNNSCFVDFLKQSVISVVGEIRNRWF